MALNSNLQPAAEKSSGKGREPRACRCAPTVYAVLEGQWAKLGYLPAGWRKADLAPFEDRLSEMRSKLAAGEP